MVFAHGFGCDQQMWRWITPAFEADYRLVLYDHVGAGHSDLSAYDRRKYGTLSGYAGDLLEICAELDLHDAVFVGHSVSAMIGVLAAIREPGRFGHLILVGPSPRYLDDEGYVGGFTRPQIDQLLAFLDSNHLGWSQAIGPVIIGKHSSPALADELINSFCRTDPAIARDFARVTFLSDNRADLSRVVTPTLILQCQEDVIAPPAVGEYVHAQIARSRLVLLNAAGHCPHMSAPDETITAIKGFLSKYESASAE